MAANVFVSIFLVLLISLTGCLSDINDTLDLQTPLHELFIVKFEELAFNWSHNHNKIEYKILYEDYPDLPEPFRFIDTGTGKAYLYGVLDDSYITKKNTFSVIAINWELDETKLQSVSLTYQDDVRNIDDSLYEIFLKIDNLNVVDILQQSKMELLKDVISNLWSVSSYDLHVTYLESSIESGSRMPLDPNDHQGLVLKLASKYVFSAQLRDLEKEVRPLWKLSSCPRNFKRTSVEVYFRNSGLVLDWCKFRLIENERSHSNYSSIKDPAIKSGKYRFVSSDELPNKSYLSIFLKVSLYSIICFVGFIYSLHYVLFQNYDRGNDKVKNDIFKKVYWAKETKKTFDLSEKDRRDIYATLKSNSNALYSVSRNNTLTRHSAY